MELDGVCMVLDGILVVSNEEVTDIYELISPVNVVVVEVFTFMVVVVTVLILVIAVKLCVYISLIVVPLLKEAKLGVST